MRLTPCSINNVAKIKYEIASQPHWYDRLRIAENIIDEKQDAIARAQIDMTLNCDKLKIRLAQQDRLDATQKAELIADIARLKIEKRCFDRLVRDAKMELKLAKEIKQYILNKYPHIKNLHYEEIQIDITEEAYADNLAGTIASNLIERRTGIPATIVNLLAKNSQVAAKVESLLPQKLHLLDNEVLKLKEACEAQPGNG